MLPVARFWCGAGFIGVLITGCSNPEEQPSGPEQPGGPQAAVVPRYEVFERTFPWKSGGYTKPWEQVKVTMTFTSPSGRTVTVGGFYQSTDTWKARFAPTDIGQWRWQAEITDGDRVEQSSGQFEVAGSTW